MTLDLALSYAARSWPVFPCRSKEEVDPNTGEVLNPKTPYPSNGLKSASLNERIIREWWRRTPDAMVGVPTGRATKVWVLDLDRKPGVGDGHDWLADMEAEHGALPDTARAKTMGGGTHIFFNYAEGIRNRGGLGAAVDVRGEGGYIIAPGSQAANGQYEWLSDSPIQDAPQWLLDLVLPKAPSPASTYNHASGDNEPYVEAAFRQELDALAVHPAGGRGHALNATAFKLGTLVGAGALSRQEAENGLWAAAVACGVASEDGERETRSKIRRGLDSGIKNPRSIPKAYDDGTPPIDTTFLLRNKAKEREATERPTAEQPDESPNTQDDNPPEALEPSSPTPPPAFVATPFNWKDPKSLPRREFTYGTHYIRKYVSVTVSPGGLGKTSNSIVEALAMASGKPLLGVKPTQRLKVWLFNAEDPRDEMERRIMAACLRYNLRPTDIEGHLFLDSGREQQMTIASEDKRAGFKIHEPIINAVADQIEHYGIDVMIVDPFVSTHGVNENDNGAIDKVAKLWAQIADVTNSAIDVVHHLRKVSDREATVEDARGAVSLIGAARSVRVLNRMTETQADEAGVPKADRFGYFYVNVGKANLTPMSMAQDWRLMVSQPLGNGGGLSQPQDHVGVVTEWKWPNAEEVVAGLPDGQLAAIKAALSGGTYKNGRQAKTAWAGLAIAYALGLDAEDDGVKDRMATLLKSLVKEGHLVVVEDKDPTSRMVTKFVRVA